jgi:cytochrome c
MKKQACVAAHAIDKTVVGHSFDAVKLRYEKKADAEAYLADRIRLDGVGAWGQVPMRAQSGLSESQLRVLAEWILRRTN